MQFRYIVIVVALLLSGCNQKKAPQAVEQNSSTKIKEEIFDLVSIDQNISVYIPSRLNKGYIATLQEYESHYFLPWNIKKIDISIKDAKWAYRAFNEKNSYGSNLLPLKKRFFQEILENSNFSAFTTLNKRAITLKAMNIRAFPTDKPLFMNPNKAGEGYPFDYLQNSLIAANKPLLVSHYTKDKEWVFIRSSFTFGWVKARDIVFISQSKSDFYKKAKKIFFIKEGIGIYDQEGNFLFDSRIGMSLPKISESQNEYTALTITNFKNTQAYYIYSKVNKNIAHQGILEFNKENIIKIFNEVSRVKYGWGGIYKDRDCSSTLRDFFAPFGVWLPRNSYKQSKIGKIISFKGLSDAQKLELIKEKAIPFETLLYKRGHILLYVGVKNNKVIVFHNVWGIKTKKNAKEGRFIIGKPVFSTLEIGSHLINYDRSASILSNLKSMNIITQ